MGDVMGAGAASDVREAEASYGFRVTRIGDVTLLRVSEKFRNCSETVAEAGLSVAEASVST